MINNKTWWCTSPCHNNFQWHNNNISTNNCLTEFKLYTQIRSIKFNEKLGHRFHLVSSNNNKPSQLTDNRPMWEHWKGSETSTIMQIEESRWETTHFSKKRRKLSVTNQGYPQQMSKLPNKLWLSKCLNSKTRELAKWTRKWHTKGSNKEFITSTKMPTKEPLRLQARLRSHQELNYPKKR